MKGAHKEEMGENRMLLPAITTGVGVGHHSYPPPMQFELLPGQERPATGGTAAAATTTQRHDATKDAGLDLDPSAMAALRAALAGKSHVETATVPPPPIARPEGVAAMPEWRAEGRVPVLKTSTGTFLVTPTPPQGPPPFPSRPGIPARLRPNAPPPPPPPPHGPSLLPDQQFLFKTPERRINVQGNARATVPAATKSPVSTYLVQASSGQYRIMSGGDAARSAETRMLPIELNPHAQAHMHHQPQHGLQQLAQQHLSNAQEAKSLVPLPPPPPHLSPMFAKTMKTTPMSLTPKFQMSALVRPSLQLQQQQQQQQQQQLSQKLLERPGNAAAAFMEPLSSTGNLEAAAENLKNLFLSESSHLPVPPLENLNFNPLPSAQPSSDFFSERTTVSHKRRKTSTPASLDDLPPLTMTASQQTGLELLLQAAKSVGDALPLNNDYVSRRSSHGRRVGDDHHLYGSRLDYCLDPALRHCYGVLDSFTGVYPLLNGSFVARVRFKGCYVLIGTFKTAEDAARAYDRVVLSIRGRKARTNYPYSEYLNFELQNAKRAFDAKFKQCERTRRGSIWPWARAAHTLLANDEEGNDDVVPELVHSVSPLTEAISGESVFELLQNVMLKRRDLNGTFDLIQAKIRQLQTRIQSGMSTEEECDCVGQYASAANILRRLVTMQNEWERKQNRKGGRGSGGVRRESTPPQVHADVDEEEEAEVEEEEETTSETKQVTLHHFEAVLARNGRSVSEGDHHSQHSELNSPCLVPKEPSSLGDEQQSRCTVQPQKQELSCPYTESIRWVRLLASSLWPRKRGGGMLWKAYQPLFKSNHHRRSILQLRQELFVKPESLSDETIQDQ